MKCALRVSGSMSPAHPTPRTEKAFGSREKVLDVIRAIELEYRELAGPALFLFRTDRGRIFRYWDVLSAAQREGLLRQVAGLDLDLLDRNLEMLKEPDRLTARTSGKLTPPQILRQEADPDRESVLASGEEVLERGWLALVEGAGGTGSRFAEAAGELPKGLYPIASGGSLNFFEERVAHLIALRRMYRKPIPYVVMISDATAEATKEFFESREYFGLKDEMLLVCQRSLPYLEEVVAGVYDLVLERPDKVAVGGYGHADFTKSVLLNPAVLEFLSRFGARYVQWLQIDNPLATIGHRYLLGAHRRAESSLNPKAIAMSFIALEKEVATEKAGVLVGRNGGLAVWEYSDMDVVSQHLLQDSAGVLYLAVRRNGAIVLISPGERTEEDELLGLPQLRPEQQARVRYLWGALNPNLVLVSLDSVTAHPEDNPPLVAMKSARHVPEAREGGIEEKKFLKFEAFLFDGLNDGVVVAEERWRCFAPTKNSRGSDSPEPVRKAMGERAARRLREIGWVVADYPDAVVELGGLIELSAAGLAERVGRNGRVEAGAKFVVQGLDVAIGDGLWVVGGGELRIKCDNRDPRAPLAGVPEVVVSPGLEVRGHISYGF